MNSTHRPQDNHALNEPALVEDWNQRLRRRRRIKVLIAWLYLTSVTLTATIHATQHWNADQFEWLAKWGSLFMTPALCVWVWQSMRRRYAIQDGGQLIARYPPQRVGPLPRWLPATAYLAVSSLPFLMLMFRDAHLLMMVAIAFAGVIMFALAWLKYDGIPVECRRRALIIDGVQLVTWDRIQTSEITKRSNVIRLQLWPRRRPHLDDDRHTGTFLPANQSDGIDRGKGSSPDPRFKASTSRISNQRPLIHARDVFVCAEDREAFLACIEACREETLAREATREDVA